MRNRRFRLSRMRITRELDRELYIIFLSEIPAILWIEIAKKDSKTRIQTLNLKHD